MKKHLGILCSLILVLSLAACGTDFDGSRTELKDYLQGLDLFIKIPSYTSLQKGERVQDLEIFLQPGMIYAHATALMQSLADNSVWMDSCGIAKLFFSALIVLLREFSVKPITPVLDIKIPHRCY